MMRHVAEVRPRQRSSPHAGQRCLRLRKPAAPLPACLPCPTPACPPRRPCVLRSCSSSTSPSPPRSWSWPACCTPRWTSTRCPPGSSCSGATPPPRRPWGMPCTRPSGPSTQTPQSPSAAATPPAATPSTLALPPPRQALGWGWRQASGLHRACLHGTNSHGCAGGRCHPTAHPPVHLHPPLGRTAQVSAPLFEVLKKSRHHLTPDQLWERRRQQLLAIPAHQWDEEGARAHALAAVSGSNSSGGGGPRPPNLCTGGTGACTPQPSLALFCGCSHARPCLLPRPADEADRYRRALVQALLASFPRYLSPDNMQV